MMVEDNKMVAVFIDAENTSAKYAEKIFSEASNYGNIIVKRIYGDWTNLHINSWKDKVATYSLKAEQQFPAVKGKNASDISLIVDVLTILFEKKIDIFCIASSDSDYTRLVQELREREKTVVGFGMKQTATAFVNSFSEFIYLDKDEQKDKKQPKEVTGETLPKDRLDALREIIDNLIEKNGKAFYGSIGTEMKNKFADFIPKNYGCKTMKEFIRKNLTAIGDYEIVTEKDGMTMCLAPKKVPQ